MRISVANTENEEAETYNATAGDFAANGSRNRRQKLHIYDEEVEWSGGERETYLGEFSKVQTIYRICNLQYQESFIP